MAVLGIGEIKSGGLGSEITVPSFPITVSLSEPASLAI